MGMTIDEAIPIIHDMYNYYSDETVEPYVGFDTDDKQAIETALDTMRKYQKIEKILNEDFEEYHPLDRNSYRLSLIRKVLEDGKID